MRHFEKTPILQLGATGLVPETLQAILAKHGHGLELEAVAAARPDHVGKKLGEITTCRSVVQDVPIISLETALHETDSLVVISALRDEEAAEYERQIAKGGRVLATNAGHNRMANDVALFHPYVGGVQLEELFGHKRPEGYIMANGNCGGIMLSVALAPLQHEIGIDALKVETLQGYSGAGLNEVPEGKEREVVPIEGNEQDKLETEPNKFFGTMQEHADMHIAALPQRGPWVRGHHLQVQAKLARAVTRDQVESLWRDFKAPEELKGIKYGKGSPKSRPIKVSYHELLEYRGQDPRRIRGKLEPMQIKAYLEEVSEDGQHITFEVVGDNLLLGAASSAVMNVVYALRKGYFQTK